MLLACPSCHLQYDVSGMRDGERIRCHCGVLISVREPETHEARLLHCSGCGGKLREHTSQCDYCGGKIRLADRALGIACPECFARLSADAKFCQECGTEICPHSVRATRLDASCPRCESELSACSVEGRSYTECTSCGGLWLDETLFEELVQNRDEEAVRHIVGTASTNDVPTPALEEDVRYLECPRCAQLMHRKNFARVSGVIIDWCKGCGFWFDARELEKILQFVQAGGMNRARSHEFSQDMDRKRHAEWRQKTLSQWQSQGGGDAREVDVFNDLGGSFKDVAGFSIFEAVQEVVGSAFGKLFRR